MRTLHRMMHHRKDEKQLYYKGVHPLEGEIPWNM